MPLVSILIPCRNASPWLRICVESALGQTHPEIEVIVFDDGSTDNSLSTIKDLEDARLRIMSGPGEGGNVARNRMLTEARGEWAQFLDADDYLEPGKIAVQLKEAGKGLDEADALLSPVWAEKWSGRLLVDRGQNQLESGVDLFALWISWLFPQTGGPLWRITALRDLSGWREDLACCQDNELYMRALQAGLRWVFCPTPGAVYRIWSEDTVCRRDVPRVLEQRIQLTDQMLDWLRKRNQLNRARELAAGQACFEIARTWAKTDINRAAKFYRESRRKVRISPRGPAAPLSYRIALAVFGFALTEKIARLQRRHRPTQ